MAERTRVRSASGPEAPGSVMARCIRARRGALLILAAGLLGGCGPVDIGPPEESPASSSQAEGSPTGVGGRNGEGEAYGEGCTGEGEHTVDSSVQRPLDGVTTAEGAQLAVALGYTAPDGPRARLTLSTVGGSAAPAEFDGEVGESSRYDTWTVTLRSICDGEVGFDVAEA